VGGFCVLGGGGMASGGRAGNSTEPGLRPTVRRKVGGREEGETEWNLSRGLQSTG